MTTQFKDIIRINGREFGHIEQTITGAQVAALSAGTTVTVAITGFPTNATPTAGRIHINTKFTGTGITAVNASIGVSGDADELLGLTDLAPGSTATEYEAPVTPGELAEESAYAPIITFVITPTTDQDNTDIAAGSLLVVIFYEKLYVP
jgi:hypothetical protein